MVDVYNELNIPYDTMRKWGSRSRKKQQEAEKEKQDQLLTASEYKKLYEAVRLERIETEEENAIFKKALHIFTQENK